MARQKTTGRLLHGGGRWAILGPIRPVRDQTVYRAQEVVAFQLLCEPRALCTVSPSRHSHRPRSAVRHQCVYLRQRLCGRKMATPRHAAGTTGQAAVPPRNPLSHLCWKESVITVTRMHFVSYVAVDIVRAQRAIAVSITAHCLSGLRTR